MNRFIPKIMCLMLLFALSTNFASAQKKAEQKETPEQFRRCGTDEALKHQYETDPVFRKMMDDREKDFQAWKAANQNGLNKAVENAKTTTLTGIVTIPLIVHIVLPNPYIVTDGAVDYFVNRLNLDFSGLNPDSTNGVPWYSVRGHSLIRFCLAKRDPSGNYTTGIERKIGNVAIGGGEPQAIKSATAGGLNPWDVTKYYNVWVGQAPGLLGIAPAIGPGTAASDGVCLNYQAFSNDPCYTIGAFALARTATHEIGHNFGLYHTFQNGCTNGEENTQLTSPACTLPASILSLPDQSPGQNNPTSGCPVVGAGSAASGCAGGGERQFQNYMDYTDDPCYSMFTNTQVERMHWVLENCRAGYLTSNGCQFPVGYPSVEGALTQITSPGGSEYNPSPTCTITNYPLPTCPGAISPRVRVENQGSSTLTSVTISAAINGGTAVSNTYTVNILPGKSQIVVLNSMATVVGSNNLVITITGSNGGADAIATNNSLNTTFTITAPTVLPRAADFVATTFPPTGFTNVTVAGTGTAASWTRVAAGNGGANGSIGFNAWSLSTGNIKDFRSTPATFAPIPDVADSIIVTFDVAHRQYSTNNERLELLYSLDCGATWLAAGYNKLSNVLATETPSSFAQYTTPAVWRTERVAVKNATIAAGGIIQFALRGTSAFGNWIYVDNINIAIPVNRDLSITTINVPGLEECLPTFTPSVIVKNNGLQTVTSYQVGYTIDGGGQVTTPLITTPLAPNATVTITLPTATTTTGNHNFRAFTLAPTTAGGTGDQVLSNDALTKAFTVKTIAITPVTEGFVATTFAPTGWNVVNPNANITWVRNGAGNGTAGSAFFDNYSNNVPGQFDDLVTLPFSTTNADSIIVSFDLAHKNYPGLSDALAVRVSNNCGATYTATTYSKSGAALATAGSSTANYTAPVATDWRRERLSIGGTSLNSGYAQLAFRNTNAYGNNIFLDNINISLLYRRDIQATAVAKPNDAECTGSFAPSINVSNKGLDTIKSFTATYIVDGGTPVVTNVTGINLAPLTGNASYPLTAVSGLAIGQHTIKMYTSNLVTHIGTGDQFLLNDTVSKIFTILGTQAAPLSENFEGTFPPSNWGRNNPDNSLTGLWSQATVGSNSSKSATMQNYTYGAASTASQVDELLTPNITYSNVDSVYLSFDIAALTKQYPGATQLRLDSFQVLVSKDCGNTFTSVFNKWGEDLQTVNDPNYSNASAFVPDNAAWKKVMMNITAAAGTSSTGLVVFFKNKSNNDNNVYIDNVNVSTVTFPPKLKQQGYLLYPSPFSGNFNIQHYLTPTDLRYVEVFDAAGRLVFRRQYGTGGANTTINVNLSNQPSGMYSVKLGYTNKQIVEKIIKTN
jgi:hypothetical protein